jgi:hypothetical protein
MQAGCHSCPTFFPQTAWICTRSFRLALPGAAAGFLRIWPDSWVCGQYHAGRGRRSVEREPGEAECGPESRERQLASQERGL